MALAVGVALYLLGQVAFHSALRLGGAGLRLAVAFAAAATAFVGMQVSAAAEIIALVLLLAALIGADQWSTRRRTTQLAAAADR